MVRMYVWLEETNAISSLIMEYVTTQEKHSFFIVSLPL
jgi:hypothetical protein